MPTASSPTEETHPERPPDVSGEPARVDKRGAVIQDMFAGVAPRYDLLNHLLSAGFDLHWRRVAARALDEHDRRHVLDLCSGTGDLALAIARRGTRVTAADFCLPMVTRAEEKYRERGPDRPRGLAGDALSLPFPEGAFSSVTVSFGIRNVASLDGGLEEIARVLEPGGRLLILEFALPERQPVKGAYQFYFHNILPWIGKLVSPRGSAYDYLPDSVADFPQRRSFVDRVAAAGFTDASWRDLTGGTVCLYSARRATGDLRL